MPAVLIVAFARPANLLKILSVLEPLQVEIYLFVDTSGGAHLELNTETVKLARQIQSEKGINVLVSESHLGVGKAVPTGIDWAFQYVDELLILEDDCIPSVEFFDYVGRFCNHLNANIRMISGINLIAESKRVTLPGVASLSSYPSIWGWYTNAQSWKSLSVYHKKLPNFLTVLGCFLRRPSKILSLSYFYAACIRVYNSEVSAWDCHIALAMLTHNYTCIIPSRNLVQNIGADAVSSHIMKTSARLSNVAEIFEFDTFHPEDKFQPEKLKDNDRLMEQEVYKIRVRHILSPVKAWIIKGIIT